MSLYFESIRVVNGRVMNLAAHQRRVNRCVHRFHRTIELKLRRPIETLDLPKKGVYKLRIQYNPVELRFTNIQCKEYQEKPIHQLALVHDNDIDYQHKSEERSALDGAFAQRMGADDILIVRDGMLTDTWYCNIALYDGEKWWTPKFPLLKGTMRDKLIQKGIIEEKNILFDTMNQYKKIRLFNAMIPWNRKKDIIL